VASKRRMEAKEILNMMNLSLSQNGKGY